MQKYFYMRDSRIFPEELSLFRKAYGGNISAQDCLDMKYKSHIEALKKNKGTNPFNGDVILENYSDDLWEGMSIDLYVKKYPLEFHNDGTVRNYKTLSTWT